jgi:UDP-N-acetyl-D-glucosamine dehydrogenase
MKIAIVGLGYVGLPLSLQFARSGVDVIGLDVDVKKVEALMRGESFIKHIAAADIKEQVEQGRFRASTDFGEVAEVEAVVICVPTPLNKYREPDISYVLETGRSIAPFLGAGRTQAVRTGAQNGRREEGSVAVDTGNGGTDDDESRAILVVLESTTYPGTTDEDLRRVLEEGSGLTAGTDFHLAFSPEREDPANPLSKVAKIPKVVGGYTPECLERATELYSKAIDTLVPVSSCRAAEATKLLENIFRGVNIALVNELKVVYEAMGIDVWEVIDAAKTKPFGFMPFYPGPGLGGHCIPIDPFYLTWKAREYGQHTRFIELAGEVNSAMPLHVVHKVADALNQRSVAIRGSRILFVGLAYKADVDDMRESPTFVLMDKLAERGADISYFDPWIPEITPTREHDHWTGTRSVEWTKEVISSFDCVVISTAHSTVNYGELAAWSDCIVDTRNAMAKAGAPTDNVVKA